MHASEIKGFYISSTTSCLELETDDASLELHWKDLEYLMCTFSKFLRCMRFLGRMLGSITVDDILHFAEAVEGLNR